MKTVIAWLLSESIIKAVLEPDEDETWWDSFRLAPTAFIIIVPLIVFGIFAAKLDKTHLIKE